MYNFSLLVAGIAGMVTLDIIIRAYIKSWKDVLGETACAILLAIMAWLLSLEGITKQIGDNFVLWCLAILSLAAVIAMIWVHIDEIVKIDRKRKHHGNSHPTPANPKKGSK